MSGTEIEPGFELLSPQSANDYITAVALVLGSEQSFHNGPIVPGLTANLIEGHKDDDPVRNASILLREESGFTYEVDQVGGPTSGLQGLLVNGSHTPLARQRIVQRTGYREADGQRIVTRWGKPGEKRTKYRTHGPEGADESGAAEATFLTMATDFKAQLTRQLRDGGRQDLADLIGWTADDLAAKRRKQSSAHRIAGVLARKRR